MDKNILLCTFLLICGIRTSVIGQSVGINTVIPDPSAALEVKSTDKGMLVPRLKKIQRLTIQNPAEGLLVFDIDSKAFWYYESGWKKISDNSKNVWLREGSVSPAEVGDSTIYFTGNIAIGKDTSGARLNIFSEEAKAVNIIHQGKNFGVPVGINLILDDSSTYQQQGIRTELKGLSRSRIGHMIFSNSNDSITNWAYGNWVDLSNSTQINDSIERSLIGAYNTLRSYQNTVQVGVRNRLNGSTFARQRGTLNEMRVSGAGEQIGTYNVFDVLLSGTGDHIGTKNKVIGEGKLFGTYQEFSTNSDSTIVGLYNEIPGSFNNGDHYGVFTEIDNAGDGKHFGAFNKISGSGSEKQYGTYNLVDNTGSNIHYGTLNELEGSATGNQYGSFQSVTNSGSGQHTGTQNTMGGPGNGIKIGVNNSLSATGSGTQYGIKNTMVGGGGGTHYGSHTIMGASGKGDKFADWNSIINNKDGVHYGEYTILSGSGSGIHYGSNIELSGSGSGAQYGHIVDISNTGNAAHFGNRATLSGSGNGLQYGNSNVITNAGSSAHYGTQNTLLGDGTGLQFGTYNSINVSGNSSHYGTFNQILGTGTGNHVAGYFDALGSGSNRYAAIFNSGKVVVNEVSGDYDFRVESNNNQNMLFVDASANKIGIGTILPEKELDVRGSVLIERNSNSSSPHISLKEIGADYSRLTFLNDQVDTTYWTIAGRTNHTDPSSRFNIYYNQLGNIMSLHGDGDAVFSNRLSVGAGEPEAVIHGKSTNGTALLKLENSSAELLTVTAGASISIGGTPSGNNINTVYMPTKVSLGVGNPFYRFSLPNSNVEGIGLAIAKNWMEYSDGRVKKNVVKSQYGLNEVLSLQPVQYDHHSSSFGENGLEIKEDYSTEVGFIAQEVYEVIKDIVKKPENENESLWSMDYEKLTPVLVKAIQEQQVMINQLRQRNSALTTQLNEQSSKFSNELAEIKKVLGLDKRKS